MSNSVPEEEAASGEMIAGQIGADQNADGHHVQTNVGDIIKRVWISLQVAMMIYFMIRGVIGYNSLVKGWTKMKSLWLFQTILIVYLWVNEFTHMNFYGIFLLLLFSQWTYFMTFSLVIDSCITSADDNSTRCLSRFNLFYRGFVHLLTLSLLLTVFFVKDCYGRVYPGNFVLLVFLILVHQVYDLILKSNDYLIDWDNLPMTAANGLRYNKQLFEKQAKCLFYGNILFGTLSVVIVCFGFFIINRQQLPGHEEHLECYQGNEWIYISLEGNIFGTLHQMLILMQINFQIFVLVRIPKDMKIFEKKQLHRDLHHAILSKLDRHTQQHLEENKDCNEFLGQGQGEDQEGDCTTINDSDAFQRVTNNQQRPSILGSFKTKLIEASTNKDDNLRL